MKNFSDNSDGHLHFIKSKKDFDDYLKIWKDLKKNKLPLNVTAGLLGIEGSHALDGKLENVQVLFDHGIRYIGLAHFFDNEMAGSAHGETKYGLTEKGRQLVAKMQELGILIDVAHVSEATVDDVLKMATKPIISSHTGVRATCFSPRNLKDEHLVGIAKTGGLINIAFFAGAVCNTTTEAIVDAIEHTTKLVGPDHVGLGSDFDGAVKTPYDVTGIIEITDLLLKRGFSKEDVAKIMGGNALRFMEKFLR